MIKSSQIASKEMFVHNDKEWIISGFSDTENPELDWYNLYDFDYLQLTGELLPFYRTPSDFDGLELVEHYDEIYPVATKEDLLAQMNKDGFVCRY